MEAYLLEWLNLTVKWIHMIVGIAWIGASFYFNWLEGNLERNKPGLDKGVAGEVWAIHGGGFYHVEKFEVAPEQLPTVLHWFKWEAYMTFLTGFFLLIITLYLAPTLFLIDTTVADISPALAISIGIGSIVLSWLVYDQLCKTTLVENNILFFGIIFTLLTIEAYFLTQIFSAKAAFIHVGAIIGTIMVANVFFGIIPSQKKMVAALEAGEKPNPITGKIGYQRSFHNNYFTLPVLFIMISGHYPATFGSELNWLILAAISLIGVMVRHYFNLKNRGKNHVWILPIAAFLMFLLAYLSYPNQEMTEQQTSCVTNQQIKSIIDTHCLTCHASQPSSPMFSSPPKGIVLETVADLIKHADISYAQTVTSHVMPLGNTTKMSDEERNQLANWYLETKQPGAICK